MGYGVSLKNPTTGEIVELESPQSEGSTFAIGGSVDARMGITYNYADIYRLFNFNVTDDLNGKKAGETRKVLKKLVKKLGTRQYSRDYWAPTPGNAGHALSILLDWANSNPDAVWEVD
jgi:hypothetical protein